MGTFPLPLGNLGNSNLLSFNSRQGYTICNLASFSVFYPLTLPVGRLMNPREGEYFALSSCISKAASIVKDEPAPGSGVRSCFPLLTSCPGQSFCVKGLFWLTATCWAGTSAPNLPPWALCSQFAFGDL